MKMTVRITCKRVLGTLAALVAAGLAIAWSGIVSLIRPVISRNLSGA